MKISIGDKVKNVRSGQIGIVVRIFKSGSIGVLERIAPTVICTHDSFETLEIIEKNSIDIFDESIN